MSIPDYMPLDEFRNLDWMSSRFPRPDRASYIKEIEQNISDIQALLGTPEGGRNLGVFGGDIIPDNTTLKVVLQALENVMATLYTEAPVVASEADAIDGTDNHKVMTPLRTAQAVDPKIETAKDRANHTGVQAINTIEGLSTALATKLSTSALALSTGADLSGYGYSETYKNGTVGSKLQGLPISVKEAPFNAKGDGVTDDSAAIQAANNAAKDRGVALYFPPGTYCLAPNAVYGTTSWCGAGRDVSIIKAKSTEFWSLSGLVMFQNQSNFTITDLGFDLAGGTYPPGVGNPGNLFWAIQIQNCSHWMVKNCKFINIAAHTIGLAVDAGSRFTITQNFFHCPVPSTDYNQSCNISFASGLPTFYVFSDNILDGSGFFTNGQRGIVTGNHIIRWKFGGGLTFGPNDGCINHTIMGNTIIGIGPSAQDVNEVWITGIECWSSYSLIALNYIENCAGDGIGTGGFGSQIIANKILNCGQGDGTTTGTGSGITLISTIVAGLTYTSSNSVVSLNIVLDTQDTPTMLYSFAEYQHDGAPEMFGIMYSQNRATGWKTARHVFSSGLRSYAGPQLFKEANCTVGSLNAGASYDEILFFAGVRAGDKVGWGYSDDSRGYSVIAHTVSDNVILTVTNVSGATKAAPVGQKWTIWVEKAPNNSGF